MASQRKLWIRCSRTSRARRGRSPIRWKEWRGGVRERERVGGAVESVPELEALFYPRRRKVYRLLTAGLAALGLLATASRAAADITWVERGDAGGLPATAQITEGDRFQPLTAITGIINGNRDADMFQIFISDPSKFSATTVGTPGTLTDSQLFLFDANGK